MANNFIGKFLADGQLPSAIGDLYTVPPLTRTIIKTIILVNTDIAAQTTNIYVKKSGGIARRVWEKDRPMMPNESQSLGRDELIILGAGDKIQGDCSLINVIDFTIFGIEET